MWIYSAFVWELLDWSEGSVDIWFPGPQTNGLSSGPRVSGKVMDIKQMKQECEQARKHNKAVQRFYFWFNRNQIELYNFFVRILLDNFIHPYTLETSSSVLATHEGVVVMGCCRFHEVVSEQQTYSVYCRLAAAPWQFLSWWCRLFVCFFFLIMTLQTTPPKQISWKSGFKSSKKIQTLWDNVDSINPLFNYKTLLLLEKSVDKVREFRVACLGADSQARWSAARHIAVSRTWSLWMSRLRRTYINKWCDKAIYDYICISYTSMI